MPLGWNLADRRDYLQEMFGFRCSCRRCFLEEKHENYLRNLKQATRGVGQRSSALKTSKASKQKSALGASMATETPLDEAEEEEFKMVTLFLLRHMCTHKGCTGTLTPIPPSGFLLSKAARGGGGGGGDCLGIAEKEVGPVVGPLATAAETAVAAVSPVLDTISQQQSAAAETDEQDAMMVVYECNICGFTRTYGDFIASLQSL